MDIKIIRKSINNGDYINGLSVPLRFAIKNQNLILINQIMKLPIWKKLDKYPFPYTSKQFESPPQFDLFPKEELIAIGLICYDLINVAPKKSKINWLYDLHLTFKKPLSELEYYLFHLRKYWNAIFIKCFMYLAAQKYDNWEVYKRLDYPINEVNYFAKPSYSEHLDKSWMHYALECNLFKEEHHFIDCYSHYKLGEMPWQLDENTRKRYYSVNTYIDFLQLACKYFPNNIDFIKAYYSTLAIEDLQQSELNIYLTTLQKLEDALIHRDRVFQIYSTDTPNGEMATGIEMLSAIENIRKNKDNLDWAVNPFYKELCFIKNYRPKQAYPHTRWEKAFPMSTLFTKFAIFRPGSDAIKYFQQRKSFYLTGKSISDLEYENAIQPATKEISDLFGKLYNDLNKNLGKKQNTLIRKSTGLYQLNPKNKFIMVIDEKEIEKEIMLYLENYLHQSIP